MSVPAEGIIPFTPLSPEELLAKGQEASKLAPRDYEAPKEDPFAPVFNTETPDLENPTTPFGDLDAITGNFDAAPGVDDEIAALARSNWVFMLPAEFTAAYATEYGNPRGNPEWDKSKWSPTETDIMQASEKYKLDPADYAQLAYARAPEELEIRARVLGERRENANYVANQYTGVSGFAAQMGVGMFDPAFLVAGGAVGSLASGVKTTTSAGNVLKSMAVAGMADGSIEFANASIDPLVSYQDATIATLASVGITGALSGVGEFLTYRQGEQMQSRMNAQMKAYAEAAREADNGDPASSAGAKQNNPVPRVLEDEDGNPLLGEEFEDEDFVWNVLDESEGVPDANVLPSFGAPVRSVGQSPDAELRGLGSVLVEDPTKPGLQRQTVAEKAHRVNEAGAVYLRKMQNAAKNYWRARGQTSIWGGVNPLQQHEFDKIVHMVATREVKNLPAEWLEDADIAEAVQVFRDGNKENLFLLQNREYTPGSGTDGEWTPGGPSMNDGSDAATEWLAELEEYNRAKPTGEATSAELNRATREGSVVGAAAGAAIGGATGASSVLFTDDDHRYAGALLGSVALAVLGGRRARGNVRASRQAQLQRWKRRYPTAGLFTDASNPNADLEAKAQAEQMETDGVDRDVIWKKTGWGRDPKGKWFTEVETPVGWTPNVQTLELDEEFLSAFPEVRDVLVNGPLQKPKKNPYLGRKAFRVDETKRTPKGPKASRAGALQALEDEFADLKDLQALERSFEAKVKWNRENPKNLKEITKEERGARKAYQAREEEFQNRRLEVLQDHASEPKGGLGRTLESLIDENKDASPVKAGGAGEAAPRHLGSKGDTPGRYTPAYDGNPATLTVDTGLPAGERLATMIHELQHGVQDATNRPRGTNVDVAGTVKKYLQEQGEAEARLAEVRLGKPTEWRRANPPWKGLDVSEDSIWSSAENAAQFSARLKDDLRVMRQDGWLADNSRYVGFDDEGREVWDIDLPDTDDGIQFRLTPYDEGVVEAEWDWQSNAKNPETEMAMLEGRAEDGMKAFEAVNQQVQALLREGDNPFIVFTGLTGGHARQQKKLLQRRPADGYKAVLAEYETSRGTKNVFALVKGNVTNMEETLQGFYSKAKLKMSGLDAPEASLRITEIDESAFAEKGPYTGVRGMEDVKVDPTYAKRSFNKEGYDAAMNLHGEVKVRTQFADAIYAHPTNKAYFDELGRKKGKDGWELARSVSAKYLRTLNELMNDANPEGNPYRTHSKARQKEAKEVVKRNLEGELGDNAEEVMDLLLELIAPTKQTDLPNFAKRKLAFELDYQKHQAILDIWDWNATKSFATARRNIAGHVGFNSVGVNDVGRYEARIGRVRRRAAENPKQQEKIHEAADKLERMTDAVMGVSRAKDDKGNRVLVMLKRYNMARLLNKVAFSMFGELGLAMTTAGPLRFADTIMRVGKFRKALKEGRYEDAEPWVAMVDDLMGHGTAQVRSRLASSITERGVAETAALSEGGPIWKAMDIGTRKMANASARLSGMAPITETLRLSLGVNLAKKFYFAAQKGKMPYSMKRMRDLGIDEAMWQRISEQLNNMRKVQSPDTGRSLPDFDRAWQDAEAFDAFIAAIDRKVRRLNMDATVGHTILVAGERPVYGAFFQFFQFPQGSLIKHTGNAAAMRDPQAAVEILVAGGFSLLGVLAKVYAGAMMIKDEEERQEYIEKHLEPRRLAAKAVYYTPHASHIPTLIDVGAAATGQEPLFSQARNSDLATLGANPLASNPTSDFINQIFKTPARHLDGTTTKEDFEDFVKLFPLGNHLVTQAVTDEFAQYLPEENETE